MYVTRIFEIALLTISLNNSFKNTSYIYKRKGEEFTLFYWPSKMDLIAHHLLLYKDHGQGIMVNRLLIQIIYL